MNSIAILPTALVKQLWLPCASSREQHWVAHNSSNEPYWVLCPNSDEQALRSLQGLCRTTLSASQEL